MFGQYDQDMKRSIKAAELCEAAGNAEDAGFAYMIIQWTHLFRSDFYECISSQKDTLRMMEREFHLRWYHWAFVPTSWSYAWLGRWDEALEDAHECLRVSEEYSDNSLMAYSKWVIAIPYIFKGDTARGVEYAQKAWEEAPTPGDKIFAQMNLGWALCRAGDLTKGIELLSPIVPLARASRFVQVEIIAGLALGEGYWLAGDYEKARQTLQEEIELSERCEMRAYTGWAHRLLGEVALKTDIEHAGAHFEKSIDIFRQLQAENELALAYAGYGRLYKLQGDIVQAREYLAKALEIFDRLGTLIEPDKVRKELAELSGD
jgi:tetratricopeptide (TPR) repeat protein